MTLFEHERKIPGVALRNRTTLRTVGKAVVRIKVELKRRAEQTGLLDLRED